MNKITKTILWGLLAFALLPEGSAWAQAGPKEAAVISVLKLDEGLYYMEYKGDDGFAGLKGNGKCGSVEVPLGHFRFKCPPARIVLWLAEIGIKPVSPAGKVMETGELVGFLEITSFSE